MLLLHLHFIRICKICAAIIEIVEDSLNFKITTTPKQKPNVSSSKMNQLNYTRC